MRLENSKLRQGFGRFLWKDVVRLQSETSSIIYGNTSGWWNATLSLTFLEHFFGTRNASDTPVLLLWDSLSSHWTDDVVAYAESKSVILVKVPPSCTFCCQPADLAWFKPMKARLRATWVEYMREQIVLNGHLTPPKRDHAIRWTCESWNTIARSTVVNGFKKVNLLFDLQSEQVLWDRDAIERHEQELVDVLTSSLEASAVIDAVLRSGAGESVESDEDLSDNDE